MNSSFDTRQSQSTFRNEFVIRHTAIESTFRDKFVIRHTAIESTFRNEFVIRHCILHSPFGNPNSEFCNRPSAMDIGYDGEMKTLVITADGEPLPPELEEVIRRGSTAVERIRGSELPAAAALPQVDRVVFWASGSASPLRPVVDRFVRDERKTRREVILFVSTVPDDAGAGLSATERFVWPHDRDRLTMAFMTGA
jgi:hypothetical protein